MSKIVGEEIPSYVAQQINKRQALHGKTTRTDQDILYLNSKTAWVKLASGVYDISDTSLAKNNILYSGLSEFVKADGTLEQKHSFNAKYGDGNSEYGYQPMPGIVSADIRCMNRGSIKKATVQIKVFTPEQFHIIDKLYLRIGYTMLLEWGNSMYLDNGGVLQKMGYTLIEADQGFFWCSDYYQMLGKIERYRKDKFGNYDGLIAKVVNFNWHISQDGSYDITLELISAGDVVESLKTNITPSKTLADGIEKSLIKSNTPTGDKPEADTKIPPTSNIISAYLYFQHLLNSNLVNYSKKKIHLRIDDINVNTQIGHFIKISPTGLPSAFIQSSDKSDYLLSQTFLSYEAAEAWAKTTYPDAKPVDSATPLNNEYVIRNSNAILIPTANVSEKINTSGVWEVIYNENDPEKDTIKFGKILQGTRNVAFIDYENKTSDPNDAYTGYYMRFGHLLNFLDKYVVPKSGEFIKIVKIYSGPSKMYRHPLQYSVDPRVCVVAIPKNEPIRSKTFLVDESGNDFEKEYVQWKMEKSGWAANSMNIFIHHPQIIKSLEANLDDKGNLSLFNFLKDICNALNVALGGLNNLEPIIDETDNMLHIIDSSFHSSKGKGESIDGYELELYGYNTPGNKQSNFVRSFNLKTEITPEFATMASIGATAAGYVKGTENTMFSRWNKGLIDRFQKEWYAPTSDTSAEARDESRDMYVSKIWKGQFLAFGYTKNGNKIQLNDNQINNNISIATEFFKFVQSELRNRKKEYASTQNGFIPISLGVTMDGISGIKIYNSLHVSTRFLPEKYPENLVFIIKGVNHKLSNNDWETTVETVVVSKVNK